MNWVPDPGQKDRVQKAGLEISYNMDLSGPSREQAIYSAGLRSIQENKAREGTGDQYLYSVVQVRTEGPGPS